MSRLSLNTKEEYQSVMSKIDEKSLVNSVNSHPRRGTVCSNYSQSHVSKNTKKRDTNNSNEPDRLTAYQNKSRITS